MKLLRKAVSMNQDSRKEEIIKAATSMDFHPVEFTDSRKLQEYQKIPMTDISGLGSIFAEMIPGLRTVTKTATINAQGLYRCTFPSGIAGRLAEFNDGSGSLGTIINKNGIVGQARWNPAGVVSATQTFTVPISPASLFIAATLIQMNHKLDKIQKLGEDILNYQKERDRAKQEANFEELVSIYNKLKYNIQDQKWHEVSYVAVQSMRRETVSQIKLLRSQIEGYLDKHNLIHSKQDTAQMMQKVQNDFQLYRLGVFMYSFATYLMAILHENFSQDYLKTVCDDIDKYVIGYRLFYTDCYNKLEHSSRTSLESKLIQGIASVSSTAGKVIHNIPVVEKGPIDEKLMDAGKSLHNYDVKLTEKAMKNFKENMSSGARQFEEGIEEISRLYNSPMEVLLDQDNVYIKLAG